MKDKNHMIISIVAEKAFIKIQHLFIIKNSCHHEHRGNIFQHNKGHKWQPRANIILSGENMKAFPLKSRTRQKSTLSPGLFNTVLEFSPS